MIYFAPTPDEFIDQGDLIDECPVVSIIEYHPGQLKTTTISTAEVFAVHLEFALKVTHN